MNQSNTKQNKSNLTSRHPVSLDDIVQRPAPGLAAPSAFRFSPDERLVTYLFSEEGGLSQNLYALDIETGEHLLLAAPPEGGVREESLSPEEELMRERMRQVSLGITQYTWDKKQHRILIPLQGSLYILDEPGAELRLLLKGGSKPMIDPQFSSDGNWIAYVQDAEIYIVSTNGGEPRQLTSGARGSGKTHGLAEYIAQEEMSRHRGYWWSPDGKNIAFCEVDETHIPVFRIMHQGKDHVDETTQEDHRYPFVGSANAKVRLGVVPFEGGEPVWMDYSTEEYEYLARVNWLPDLGLVAQITNRAQDELLLVRFDPQTGVRKQILHEKTKVWINLHDILKPLKKLPGFEKPGFLWASERTGFKHLYLYDVDGNLIRQLTSGDWMVEELVGYDADNDLVYFSATQKDARERHLYSIPLAGGEIKKLSPQPGIHQCVMDKTCSFYVETFSSLSQPPEIGLYALPGGDLKHKIFVSSDPRLEEIDLPAPEFVTIQNRDGVPLHGAIYHPPASYGPGPYPTVISVYGGPHAQRVINHWSLSASMQDQYLASLGFLVFKLDNQGSARRGLAFEGIVKHRLGQTEVQDQVDGVRYLTARGLTDPQRVGIYGWSYGGYMSAMCLMQEPLVFKTAVAGAPVTNYDGYDTHYTERYMGTPQENPEGYSLGSVQNYVEKLEGKLMIIHGLIDENVHFRHTARLINALIAADKPYDLLLLPDSRHVTRKPVDIRYLAKRTAEYFLQNL